jgi:hypothetical protein
MGPVSAAAPCDRQLSSAACASGARASRGTPAVAASSSANASRVTRKFDAIEAAAWYAARSASAISNAVMPIASAIARARSRARGVDPATAAGTPANEVSPVTVMRGWMPRASCGASGSRVVAPEKCPTSRPGATSAAAEPISASGTARSTMSASAAVAPRPRGPVTSTPAPRSAAATARPTRPSPTTATAPRPPGRARSGSRSGIVVVSRRAASGSRSKLPPRAHPPWTAGSCCRGGFPPSSHADRVKLMAKRAPDPRFI